MRIEREIPLANVRRKGSRREPEEVFFRFQPQAMAQCVGAAIRGWTKRGESITAKPPPPRAPNSAIAWVNRVGWIVAPARAAEGGCAGRPAGAADGRLAQGEAASIARTDDTLALGRRQSARASHATLGPVRPVAAGAMPDY